MAADSQPAEKGLSITMGDLQVPLTTGAIDWAQEVESQTAKDGPGLPPIKEIYHDDNTKTVIEYYINDKGDKMKVETVSKIIKKRVPKQIAERKKWPKFGDCQSDPKGPTHTTFVSDEVKLQFTRNRAGELIHAESAAEENVAKLAGTNTSIGAHCRFCKGNDHWSKDCPYKELYGDMMAEEAGGGEGTEQTPSMVDSRRQELEAKKAGGTFVPSRLLSGVGRGTTMNDFRDRRDDNTVRVTNLPEDADEQDIRDLFNTMGSVSRIYLAKDKSRTRSKGFAFVTFYDRNSAEQAISSISKHRYEHSILKVEWARQDNNR